MKDRIANVAAGRAVAATYARESPVRVSAPENRPLPGARLSLAEVRAYIDRHFVEPLPVPHLAELAGLSPFHFIRAFRATVGVTPHRYLRERRLERASELLITTALPVTEICDRVGFQSLGSFSALFRRAAGESPSEYRAKRRKRVYIPTCFIRMYRAD